MPGAGFYAIHTAQLTFRADGRWYADDEPVVHERLARLFSRHVRRKPAGTGYEIWIDERYHADVVVEDTPFVVTALHVDPDGDARIDLNDGSVEALDADSLEVGEGNVVYCRVKDGKETARLLRPAYYQLAEHVEETPSGEFRFRRGSRSHAIRRR